MGQGFGVDPVELARLARQLLAASQQLAAAWRSVMDKAAVPAAAFGNSGSAPAAYLAHTEVMEAAGVAVGRQVEVSQDDVDRVYRTAFAYQRHDKDARDRVRRTTYGRWQ